MRYRLRLDISAYDEFAAAVEWCVEHRRETSAEPSWEAILAAFAPVLRHPQLRQPYSLPSPTDVVLRRVNVRRLAFLYRVEEETSYVVITRIYHERSAEL